MLAAGKGTRAYPFGRVYPKLLFQVGGIPVLEYMLSWFDASSEVSRVCIAVNREWGDVIGFIERYVSERPAFVHTVRGLLSRFGLVVESAGPAKQIDVIAVEGDGTGGDLRSALEMTGRLQEIGELVVCNSDYITIASRPDGRMTPSIPLDDMVSYHRRCRDELGSATTVGVVHLEREDLSPYGNAVLSEREEFLTVQEFSEKPRETKGAGGWINAGVYVLSGGAILPDIDTYLPKGPDSMLELTMLRRLVGEGGNRLAAYPLDLKAWFDLATVEQLVSANLRILGLADEPGRAVVRNSGTVVPSIVKRDRGVK